MPIPPKPRVFVDADVLFAGSASPTEHSASQVLLTMAEITLIEGFTSEQVIAEVERNLTEKLPRAVDVFRNLVARSLKVVPVPSKEEGEPYTGRAHPKDLPILVAALKTECAWLVTFNLSDFEPGHPDVTVLTPGRLLLHVRDQLTRLGS